MISYSFGAKRVALFFEGGIMNRRLMAKLKRENDSNTVRLSAGVLRPFVRAALAEDIRHGDLTSDLVLSKNAVVKACLIANHPLLVAGLPVFEAFLRHVDPGIRITTLSREGEWVAKGHRLAQLTGRIKSILKTERTALNVLQHLSGLASAVHQYVEIARPHGVRVTDTRKTLPLIRRLQKYAVLVGGGRNHRFSLSDGILIKDNHLHAICADRCDAIRRAVAAARTQTKFLVEVEVESVPEARVAAVAGADIIMLDNMCPAEMKKAVRLIGHRAYVEASGGITLENFRQVVKTGVDFVSIGALTHSVRAADISLEITG